MPDISATATHLSISTQSATFKIPVEDILYIESNKRKLTIYTTGETYDCYEKLDSIEQCLHRFAFIRCHQSYLVATKYITSYDRHCLQLKGCSVNIPVSRQHQKQIREYLQNPSQNGALVCIAGSYLGSVIRIKAEQRVLIGRDGTAVDIVITLPMVSRIHCEITYHIEHREYEITDYSSNGTFINGTTRLIPKQTYMVQAGTHLCFGDTTTVYKLL
jgi:hypothetical protein